MNLARGIELSRVHLDSVECRIIHKDIRGILGSVSVIPLHHVVGVAIGGVTGNCVEHEHLNPVEVQFTRPRCDRYPHLRSRGTSRAHSNAINVWRPSIFIGENNEGVDTVPLMDAAISNLKVKVLKAAATRTRIANDLSPFNLLTFFH